MTASPDAAWSCRVSIRWEFDDNGKQRDHVREISFGEEISNPKDVELALRRAQAAVLNPSAAPETLAQASEAALKKQLGRNALTFSRNVVCVDLSGPDMVDLAFIDLPGAFQHNMLEERLILIYS
jgi:hypothetical protein